MTKYYCSPLVGSIDFVVIMTAIVAAAACS